MAQLQQIQVKFSAAEDRLLLRVSSDDDLEYLFWITRRFVNLIWPTILKSLATTPSIKMQTSPQAKKEVLAFEHQKAVSNSDFKTQYKETAKTLPLGEQPILLAKLQVRRKADGLMVMALAPENGVGIDLALNVGLLHSLAELISNSVRIAEWDLQTPIKSPTAEAAAKVTIN